MSGLFGQAKSANKDVKIKNEQAASQATEQAYASILEQFSTSGLFNLSAKDLLFKFLSSSDKISVEKMMTEGINEQCK